MKIRIIKTTVYEYEPDVSVYDDKSVNGIATWDIESGYIDESIIDPYEDDKILIREFYVAEEITDNKEYNLGSDPLVEYIYDGTKE